jgi:phosphate acetyltransferase
MSKIAGFIEAAKRRSLTVVLPEGTDDRVITAARRMKDEGIAQPILLGDTAAIQSSAESAKIGLDGIRLINPIDSDQLEAYTQAYVAGRDLSPKVALRMVKRPLYFAGMMVAQGDAHTLVAGVATPTALVIQAGVLTVGLAEGIETPSSFFLMILPEFQGETNKSFIYADCAVNIDPTPAELADIAIASEKSARKLLDETPRVALLSFSTKGSASHVHVDHVSEALVLVKQKAGNLSIDGEFQADAAIIPSVAAKKVKEPSAVVGQANVLVFPDLNAGNIAYKLTQYMAGARAIGPFLQGFAKPISDLSRGATAEDIIATTAVCLAQV